MKNLLFVALVLVLTGAAFASRGQPVAGLFASARGDANGARMAQAVAPARDPAARDAMAAGADAPNAAGRAQTVTIDNFSFDAKSITVPAGTEVTWINRDDAPHKVVSTDNKFASPVLDTDGRYSHTFSTPGMYDYYCSLHPMMTGKVIVK